MDKNLNVCLLNDSFPPVLDGVANTILNYANVIQSKYGNAIVATPSYPDVVDDYSFPVVRYPSIDTRKVVGYRTGIPINPNTIKELKDFQPDIIHSHCPVSSTILARQLRVNVRVPIVMTYHSKFDYDIALAIKSDFVQSAAIRLLVKNIKACDEIWVVSNGSGENLRSLGYKGEFSLMRNGVDFPRQKATPEEMEKIRQKHHLDADIPVLLFVGRMMWYKGFKFTLDGLSLIKAQGLAFKMIFIGDGTDFEDIKEYTAKLGLADDCIFTGAIRDREILRAYYSLSDLFMLPSVFDNMPIVVLEASACGLPSLLIRGSSSAEGVTDGRNGLLVDENAESLAKAVATVIKDRSLAERMGRYAQEELYISWDDAVSTAYERYFSVIENYKKKKAEKRHRAHSFLKHSTK